ncbi:hypothetical protein [Ruficoccus sp. ZRK36]|uniref:hypothetical protein n=1 Tax=Ruficoccus sp. ZRK36 TaxID=2866311 RepID=UPI001C73983C|nr:hypothetical protein [Ruficoccus sp. ZRK36]QYY37354.1 hypothetical protein K0V07_07675 [Ruficoccus sp. ZRK36]
MAKTSSVLEWCIVRLGEDLNWWVEEISDDVHWDVDGLSIIDPRQVSHVIDQIEPLRDYDFQPEVLESAFYKFKIDKKLDDNRLRLVRVNDSLLESEDMLFALADIIDEEKGPYADFLDHITRLRVKLLNDTIDFEQKLTIEELEEEIREEQNADFMEGRAIHVFVELNSILEYVPAGYEAELEDDEAEEKNPEDEIEEDFPDVDDDEKIEEDETMKWDEDEDEEDEDDENGDSDSDDDDYSDDDEEEEEEPRSRRRK